MKLIKLKQSYSTLIVLALFLKQRICQLKRNFDWKTISITAYQGPNNDEKGRFIKTPSALLSIKQKTQNILDKKPVTHG